MDGYQYEDIVYVKPRDVVLDCGAYTGNTALYFSRKTGSDGKVYSFEPDPSIYRKLGKNINKFEMFNVSHHNLATADKTGTILFRTGGAGGQISDSGIFVPVTTIDEFIKNNKIHKVTLIKMDIEGFA